MRVIRSALCVSTLALMALAASLSAAAAQVAAPRDAIARMVAAVTARDAVAVASLYAEDAILLAHNGPILQGREAIRDIWARNFANGYAALNVLQNRAETGSDRGALVMLWEATIQPQGGGAQTIRGRSLLYFTLTPQGWVISADMWQPAP